MMLIAVNPYQQLPLYNETQKNKYKGSKLTELPPHLYAIGNECFQILIKERKSQCIIIRYLLIIDNSLYTVFVLYVFSYTEIHHLKTKIQ